MFGFDLSKILNKNLIKLDISNSTLFLNNSISFGMCKNSILLYISSSYRSNFPTRLEDKKIKLDHIHISLDQIYLLLSMF